jgi:hypothetical protein
VVPQPIEAIEELRHAPDVVVNRVGGARASRLQRARGGYGPSPPRVPRSTSPQGQQPTTVERRFTQHRAQAVRCRIRRAEKRGPASVKRLGRPIQRRHRGRRARPDAQPGRTDGPAETYVLTPSRSRSPAVPVPPSCRGRGQ